MAQIQTVETVASAETVPRTVERERQPVLPVEAFVAVGTVKYPESDGQPMGETGFHITLITYLLSMLRDFFRQRSDVYVGSNMLIYYHEGDSRKHVTPDVFVVFGVPNEERRIWQTWEEGKGPDVVFELTSKSTWDEDLGTKKGLYEWMGVREYFLFDPLDEYLHPALRGFQLTEGSYREIEPTIAPGGGLQFESEILGLLLRAEEGELQLYDQATGERLLPPPELAEALRDAEVRAQAAEAELERALTELARLRGESTS